MYIRFYLTKSGQPSGSYLAADIEGAGLYVGPLASREQAESIHLTILDTIRLDSISASGLAWTPNSHELMGGYNVTTR